MLNTMSLATLRALKLAGMAAAFEEQQPQTAVQSLPFEERLGLLVDRKRTYRDNQRLQRLLKTAKLKHSTACLENIEHRVGRGLDQATLASLGGGGSMKQHHNLLITGPTGVGKTWLACAFGNLACRQKLSTLYLRVPRLLEELKVAQAMAASASDSYNWPKPTC
jgi:DNA replication protein DnaC